MKAKAIYPKVATDLYWIQILWTLGFLGMLLLIQIVKAILPIGKGNGMNSYFDVVFVSSNIYMLVIGIIATYAFLQYYVSSGVTRKDYFKGAAIASVGLSFSIPIIASVIAALQIFIINLMNFPILTGSQLANRFTEDDGNLIGNFIQSIILTPFVDLQDNWLVAIVVFASNILMYYLVGWLIGSGFYRYGVLPGLICIVIAFVVLCAQDLLLSIALDLPVHDMFTSLDFPVFVSIAGIVILVGITLWMIRQLTKRAPIKL